jgi:hypothetical protein
MRGDQYTVTFHGFVTRSALHGDRDAKRLRGFVRRNDTAGTTRKKLERELETGKITGARYGDLIEAVDAIVARMNESCRLVDAREPREWIELGKGGRQHRAIKEADLNDYEAAQKRAAREVRHT